MVAVMRQARFSRPINWFHVSTFDEIKSQTKDEEEEEDRNLLLCQWYSWRSINKSNRLSQMLVQCKGNERARREIKRYEYTITFPVFRQKREEKAKCWRRRRRKRKKKEEEIKSESSTPMLRQAHSIWRHRSASRSTPSKMHILLYIWRATRRTFAFNRCHITRQPNEI